MKYTTLECDRCGKAWRESEHSGSLYNVEVLLSGSGPNPDFQQKMAVCAECRIYIEVGLSALLRRPAEAAP